MFFIFTISPFCEIKHFCIRFYFFRLFTLNEWRISIQWPRCKTRPSFLKKVFNINFKMWKEETNVATWGLRHLHPGDRQVSMGTVILLKAVLDTRLCVELLSITNHHKKQVFLCQTGPPASQIWAGFSLLQSHWFLVKVTCRIRSRLFMKILLLFVHDRRFSCVMLFASLWRLSCETWRERLRV